MNRPNTEIRVSFYLKKTSAKSERRGIYANIRFRGKVRQIATKVYINNPDDFQRGGLVGREYQEDQNKLYEIAKKLESYEGHLFPDIDSVLDSYYGGNVNDYPSTILQVFDYGMENKKNIKSRSKKRTLSALKNFIDWLRSDPRYSNFSIIKKAPRQMFKAYAIEWVNWMLERNLKRSTIGGYVSSLSSLFDKFKDDKVDQIPDIIENPFHKIIKLENKEYRKQQALARSIDWHYVEKIKDIEYSKPTDDEISKTTWGTKKMTDLEKARKRAFKRYNRNKLYHLIALVQAHTGMAFIEFGKEDCLEITQTIYGPALMNARQKNKKPYTIFLTTEVEKMINELKPLLFNPFVKNGDFEIKDKDHVYYPYQCYLKRLEKQISFEDDKPLTSHRFRHAFGMHCMNDLKMQVHIVAKMMGDTIETILNNYADLTHDNIIREQKECLEALQKSA